MTQKSNDFDWKKALFFTGLTAVVGTGLYLGGRRIIREIRKNSAQNSFGNNNDNGNAAGFATRLKNAINPSSHAWMNWVGDGTDEDEIFRVATEMRATGTLFKDVSQAYGRIFGDDLLTDLNDDLDAKDVKKFQDIISGRATASKAIGALYGASMRTQLMIG